MGDPAGTIIDFISLSTNLYKTAVSRSNAHATLKNHLRNFSKYQLVLGGPTSSVIDNRQRRHYQLVQQAIWVTDINGNLYSWLTDSGFRKERQAGTYIVRRRSPVTAHQYSVKRLPSQPLLFKFPRFGLTGKQTTFDALFQKLKDALERLETMMADSWYQQAAQYGPSQRPPPPPGPGPGYGAVPRSGRPPPRRSRAGVRRRMRGDPPIAGSGLRGGGDDDDDFYAPQAARLVEDPNAPNSRVRLIQEKAIQDLTARLERGIAEMEVNSPDKEAYRRRRNERARARDVKTELLHEESLAEDFKMSVRLDRETSQDEARLSKLRTARQSRERAEVSTAQSDDSDETEESDQEAERLRQDAARQRLLIERERQRQEQERLRLEAERATLEAERAQFERQKSRRTQPPPYRPARRVVHDPAPGFHDLGGNGGEVPIDLAGPPPPPPIPTAHQAGRPHDMPPHPPQEAHDPPIIAAEAYQMPDAKHKRREHRGRLSEINDLLPRFWPIHIEVRPTGQGRTTTGSGTRKRTSTRRRVSLKEQLR